MASEAQRLIGISLTKIAQSRAHRGGVSLHKNLLVATVLQKARYIFMEEAYNMVQYQASSSATSSPSIGIQQQHRQHNSMLSPVTTLHMRLTTTQHQQQSNQEEQHDSERDQQLQEQQKAEHHQHYNQQQQQNDQERETLVGLTAEEAGIVVDNLRNAMLPRISSTASTSSACSSDSDSDSVDIGDVSDIVVVSIDKQKAAAYFQEYLFTTLQASSGANSSTTATNNKSKNLLCTSDASRVQKGDSNNNDSDYNNIRPSALSNSNKNNGSDNGESVTYVDLDKFARQNQLTSIKSATLEEDANDHEDTAQYTTNRRSNLNSDAMIMLLQQQRKQKLTKEGPHVDSSLKKSNANLKRRRHERASEWETEEAVLSILPKRLRGFAVAEDKRKDDGLLIMMDDEDVNDCDKRGEESEEDQAENDSVFLMDNDDANFCDMTSRVRTRSTTRLVSPTTPDRVYGGVDAAIALSESLSKEYELQRQDDAEEGASNSSVISTSGTTNPSQTTNSSACNAMDIDRITSLVSIFSFGLGGPNSSNNNNSVGGGASDNPGSNSDPTTNPNGHTNVHTDTNTKNIVNNNSSCGGTICVNIELSSHHPSQNSSSGNSNNNNNNSNTSRLNRSVSTPDLCSAQAKDAESLQQQQRPFIAMTV